MQNLLTKSCRASNSEWKKGITRFIRITQSKVATFKKSQKSSKTPDVRSDFSSQNLMLYNFWLRFGKIPPSGDFGYFWWLLWLENPIFRHDFKIGHLVAYYPIAKNRQSRFGQAHAQNRAHISSVRIES